MPEPLTFDVDARRVLAASLLVGDDESRFYLQGVFVHPRPGEDGKGVAIVATDGRAMACLWDPKGTASRPAILRVDLERRLLRDVYSPRLAAEAPAVTSFAAEVRAGETTVGRVAVEEIEAKYPDYSSAVPAFDAAPKHGGLSGFDARLLRRVAKSARVLADSGPTVLSIWDPIPMADRLPSKAADVKGAVIYVDGHRDDFWILMPATAARPKPVEWLARPGDTGCFIERKPSPAPSSR